jgi:hypothetical protein
VILIYKSNIITALTETSRLMGEIDRIEIEYSSIKSNQLYPLLIAYCGEWEVHLSCILVFVVFTEIPKVIFLIKA